MVDEQNTRGLKGKKKADFRLLVARMKEAITTGKRVDKCISILGRERIWKRLDAPSQLKWAKLAQMAGEIDLALRILEHVNKNTPDLEQAWSERLELLAIMDKRKEMAQVLAEAKPYLLQSQRPAWLSALQGVPSSEHSTPEPDVTPFAKLKERQELIKLFLDLFSGREDCFARQWVDKGEARQGYVPVRRPMQEKDVEEHLTGRKTYGIYLLRSDSTVKLAVIDADVEVALRKKKLSSDERDLLRRERSYLFSRMDELAQEMGLYPLREFSGNKGYHFWFFFDGPCPAKAARRVMERIRSRLAPDLSAFKLEVFPKQDAVRANGLGNLVKLPLGIHRLTGKRSFFTDCAERGADAQLRFLEKVKRTPVNELMSIQGEFPQAQVLVHPKMKQWADQYPDLMTLELRCPPLGQIIASCRNGYTPSLREEKVIFQTIGFLKNAKTLLHHIFGSLPEYNPHLVDYKLSRVRGKPMGCKRIHSLLNYVGDFCPFEGGYDYIHPLLHLEHWKNEDCSRSEKIEDLQSALENLKAALIQVEAFLK